MNLENQQSDQPLHGGQNYNHKQMEKSTLNEDLLEVLRLCNEELRLRTEQVEDLKIQIKKLKEGHINQIDSLDRELTRSYAKIQTLQDKLYEVLRKTFEYKEKNSGLRPKIRQPCNKITANRTAKSYQKDISLNSFSSWNKKNQISSAIKSGSVAQKVEQKPHIEQRNLKESSFNEIKKEDLANRMLLGKNVLKKHHSAQNKTPERTKFGELLKRMESSRMPKPALNAKPFVPKRESSRKSD